MANSFTFQINGDINEAVKKASAEAESNGVAFYGDPDAGSFNGKGVTGTYRTEGNTVEVTITDKPFLAPMSMIESKIKEFFS
jgi:hypothetical protein